MSYDCIILGGGASGLCAAAALAQTGLRIAVLERLDRVGKKLLATGNGRCNLSNMAMTPAAYGEAAPFVSRVYAVTPPQEILSFFSSIGLMTTCEEGRIYPRTMAASSVLDVLRACCETPNLSLLTGQEAVALCPSRRGGWSVQTHEEKGLFAHTVLAAPGGSAAAHLGTDGSGTRLLGTLGHTVTPLHPALVQLVCPHPALRSLKGIRTQAKLTLLIDGQPAAQEAGELLFTDYGVSGVCVFQLSRYASRALGNGCRVNLQINLLPEIDHTQAWLSDRIARRPGLGPQALLTGVFPRILAQAILRQANLAPDVSPLSPAQIASLAEAIHAFPLSVTGTHGFSQAQVTAGGIALDEVIPETMVSRLFDGLYLSGEVLDVDGPCGGYNLHFAFASALTAAKAIRSRLIT